MSALSRPTGMEPWEARRNTHVILVEEDDFARVESDGEKDGESVSPSCIEHGRWRRERESMPADDTEEQLCGVICGRIHMCVLPLESDPVLEGAEVVSELPMDNRQFPSPL
jgi:hypothetical protein